MPNCTNPGNAVAPQNQIEGLIALYDQGDHQRVLAEGEALIKQFPSTVVAYKILAATNAGLGRLEQAVGNYTKALEFDPDNAITLTNLAEMLKGLGRGEEAITAYEKALKIEPDHVESHNNLAGIQIQYGKYDKAMDSLAMVLKFQPENVDALYNLGVTLSRTDKHEEAILNLAKAVEIEPRFSNAYFVMGASQKALGMNDDAISSLTKALEIKNDFAEAHCLLGTIYYDLDDQEVAISNLAQALEINPDFVEANINLGVALNKSGNYDDAIASLSKALEIQPDNPQAHSILGRVLNDVGKPHEAIASLTKALEIDPDFADAHHNMGRALNDFGKPEDALASLEKAIEIKPDLVEALNELGNSLNFLGNKSGAVDMFSRALEINPRYAAAHLNISGFKNYTETDPHLHQMESLLKDGLGNLHDEMLISFALAKAYDDTDQIEKAFEMYVQANSLAKPTMGYHIQHDKKLVQQIKTCFRPFDPASSISLSKNKPDLQPIFILGMPRSGTSLAEQIIASHSTVHGAGELSSLSNIMLPVFLEGEVEEKNFSISDMGGIVQTMYLEALSKLNVQEKIISDKNPYNFHWIGFILTAFPSAKIINLNRNAKATCWSMFKIKFRGRNTPYSYDLADVAEIHNQYLDLMSFWREKFPDRIYDLNYETLTENQEQETRKLLDYCGLEWEDQCLDFYKTDRAVKTASMQQVRKKMYKGSSDEWKKYEMFLKPLIDALDA